MNDLSDLYLLLCIEEKLRVQAGFSNLKKKIRDAIIELDVDAGPAPEPVPVSVFPSDAGVDEEGTEHITPESDRGEHE